MRFFNFSQFCWMVADESRMVPYVEALRRAVTENSIVLDIGAGTGIFSLLACQFGAKKVYAIEPNPLISIAKKFAAEYNYTDKITFIQDISTAIQLEEKADILVCDLRDTLPFNGSSIASIIDARKRLLKPDALILPKKDKVYFALAEGADLYETNISRYLKDYYGFNMSSAKQLLTNKPLFPASSQVNVVSEPKIFAVLDYETIEETDFTSKLSWEIENDGKIHGLRVWFDCEFADDLSFTTSPENPGNVYGVFFLPFEEVIDAEVGDRIEIYLSVSLDNGDYVWTWQTNVYSSKDLSNPKAKFLQSTATGNVVSPVQVLKQSEYYLPQPNEAAEIDLLFLKSMDGEMLLGDIAEELLEKFPGKFKTFEDSFAYTAALSQVYSK